MGGGEFWTGMSDKTTSDTDLKTSLAMRSSDTDFTEKFAKTDYGRELPGIYKKKDDTDLHIWILGPQYWEDNDCKLW